MSPPPRSGRRIGILAGRGAYPAELCEKLRESDVEHVVACLAGQIDPRRFPSALRAETFPLGAVSAMARFFSENGATTAFFAGGVERVSALRFARPDLALLPLVPRALLGGDDALLRAIADRFEELGVRIGDPAPHLGDLLAPPGRIAGPPPSPAVLEEIAIAASGAAKNSRGQAAVAFRGRVFALEDRRGTDALLSRAPGPGAVLAKLSRPSQDARFDLPSIGPSTVRIARAVGLVAIAVESKRSLILSRKKVESLCDEAGISLVGWGGPATVYDA